MIGGIDIAIPTQNCDSSLVSAVRAILQYWPKAVFENGTTGERYDRLALRLERRHIGILVASGRPVFEGFYPLRVL